MELIPIIVYAFWLGILTSISPCPLATNIAAISFIGRSVEHPRRVFFCGILYATGRSIVYIVIGFLLIYFLMSAPAISHILQKYINKLLGPFLIVIGMILMELITFNMSGRGLGEKAQKKIASFGIWGALVLGIIFALSFCPTSAALFFGTLIPLALQEKSGIILPAVYGVGTALPVLFFAVLLAFGANKLAEYYNRVVSFERWARYFTGVIFIVIGIYYTLVNIWGVTTV